ncbi:MAG: SDR family oxidoreductase [Promethearchaeota archaeon]|nr:MAG: SDR family oxidoreductase [Candidatus Lokiarchaeota archaeon]
MSNVLVLGSSGMLGSMCFDYLSKNPNFKVYGTVRKKRFLDDNVLFFDANDFDQLNQKRFKELEIDYIINCIGITKPFCKDDDPEGIKRAININCHFPWKLAEYSKENEIRVLQICTDCVYSGQKGNYKEDDLHDPLDVYGKSKSLGEVIDGSALLIRCSIIGPELKEEKNFLLEWFLNQPNGSEIGGFAHHIWNGVTTLQFAQLCEKIIQKDKYNDLISTSYLHHFTPNNTLNKFDLMNTFNDIFEKNLEINRVFKEDQKIDRSLSTIYGQINKLSESNNIEEALKRLKSYIFENPIYNY